MISSITHRNNLCKAAIALNNTAVTLLERQQYSDAVETFRHSTSAIQAAVEDEARHATNVDETVSSVRINEINRHLQEASQRCAQSYIVNVNDDTTRPRNESSANVHVIKFSSQQNLISVLNDLVSRGGSPQATVYTCVVIEPTQQHESYDAVTMSEICNSIVYNFGVAHCILATQFNASLKSEQVLIEELQQRAFYLFRLIEPFFVEQIVSCSVEFHDRGVILLCLVFAQAMSTVAHQLQYMALGEKYRNTLRTILDSIGAQELLIPTMNQHAAMA